MTAAAPANGKGDAARARVLAAFTESVAAKGYAATTIADVVALAHVSRRTFYEHFAEKESALLASHEEFSADVIATVSKASEIGDTTAERIESTINALLNALSDSPAATKTHFVETLGAGPRAREARREMQRSFVSLLISLAERAQQRNPAVRALSPEMATAITGGLTELIVQAAEEERLADLHQLSDTMIALVSSAFLGAPS
ncbi:TetR/AcrR family transcriptional regulator [Hoyosella altamirensis]|uniref:AcrR family transcriptional regulator n=1 Tax=Hoyosella altamirensis TaxID=616997 RepID=A0A839RTV7_9ACTN|nr:TetR/AcrR family transcriptional regulator [Hoyosella altamirensis]MBB3039767.1 AcrR family transcriptional regulator [Hoyosella altamirensis]